MLISLLFCLLGLTGDYGSRICVSVAQRLSVLECWLGGEHVSRAVSHSRIQAYETGACIPGHEGSGRVDGRPALLGWIVLVYYVRATAQLVDVLPRNVRCPRPAYQRLEGGCESSALL